VISYPFRVISVLLQITIRNSANSSTAYRGSIRMRFDMRMPGIIFHPPHPLSCFRFFPQYHNVTPEPAALTPRHNAL